MGRGVTSQPDTTSEGPPRGDPGTSAAWVWGWKRGGLAYSLKCAVQPPRGWPRYECSLRGQRGGPGGSAVRRWMVRRHGRLVDRVEWMQPRAGPRGVPGTSVAWGWGGKGGGGMGLACRTARSGPYNVGKSSQGWPRYECSLRGQTEGAGGGEGLSPKRAVRSEEDSQGWPRYRDQCDMA